MTLCLRHVRKGYDEEMVGSGSDVRCPHMVTCLNTWSLAGGAISEGCRTFKKQSLAGGSVAGGEGRP